MACLTARLARLHAVGVDYTLCSHYYYYNTLRYCFLLHVSYATILLLLNRHRHRHRRRPLFLVWCALLHLQTMKMFCAACVHLLLHENEKKSMCKTISNPFKEA
uniref:Uncharacterized protein n=1 Tax=Glossina brevipalpis TaxID=37001 RepID=A0A1A9X4F9_9MUSC